MIQAFSGKYQKVIAAFFFYIFLLEFFLPVGAKASTQYWPVVHITNKSLRNKQPVLKDFAKINNPLKEIKVSEVPENNVVIPVGEHAQNGKKIFGPGPGQPEMQSFQSVNANNLVDLFSGDFAYNIPLLDVGGYPVSMHYRSGVSMDQEASWVGLGWNINPGAINRNVRGIPDDFNGEQIVKTSFIKPNWTVGATATANPEIFGKELKNVLTANAGIFYNNYTGIGLSMGASASLSIASSDPVTGGFTAGLGLGLNNNSQSGITITPSFSIKYTHMAHIYEGAKTAGFNIAPAFSTRRGLESLTISGEGSRQIEQIIDNKVKTFASNSGSFLSPITFAHQAYTPKANMPFLSESYSFNIKAGGELFGIHPLSGMGVYYSRQTVSQQTITTSSYGYLNLQNGNAHPDALLDFNREKELTYRPNPETPHLAIPIYTYDIYSISGEGTGGMFRPYRGDMGFVKDPVFESSSSSSIGGSVDLGLGNLWHAGVDVRANFASTTMDGWRNGNELITKIPFQNADSTFENVYFKNPAEKAINAQDFYDKIGDVNPVLPVMSNSDDPTLTPYLQPYAGYKAKGSPLLINTSNAAKKSRDKRGQVITWLSADKATVAGLDKNIYNYPVNSFYTDKCSQLFANVDTQTRVNSVRKANHLSEITVLNEDGKRYIYGLPVYNLDKEEVTFSVNKNNANLNTGLVSYTPGTENDPDKNLEGKDHFYSKDKTPPYAHSFLLTSVVSPDYVDRLGDGITDDDQGDAVKFNYSQVYNNSNPYHWRMPYDSAKAIYNEMLKTDNSDDKGLYSYGSKEVWYLNSIESKTMIATFVLNDPSKGDIRQDGYGVIGENGGIDSQKGLRYLKQINLYSKADYLKNKDSAVPIKVVHFAYSYDLCKGAPGSINGAGKLTLTSVWFTYNGNDKGAKNPYVFTYHANNPDYNIKSYDRWGNYKSATDNPNGLSNTDYPYSLQPGVAGWDSTKAAFNSGAWTLSDIKLPSGGKMHVDYESDDYAFVQTKRAGEMLQLTGFGYSNDYSAANNFMYTGTGDKMYVFIKVPVAATDKQDVYQKYLQGVNKLYFSYGVNMPSDVYGGGMEHVSTYAQYSDYGVSASDNKIIWIKLKTADDDVFSNTSPLVKTAIQMLKLNLPSKAFMGSDLDGNASPVALGKALIGFMFNFAELLTDFTTRCKIAGRAREVTLDHSFIRLDNPDYKKMGGGLRVKRITVSDNWDVMTGQKKAVYGQEYDYTTTENINGVPVIISSGVAAYEPSIGTEENSLHEPIEYNVQIAPLAPIADQYSETPLGEGYFPAPSVGYSKVRVHSINNKVQSATGYEESEFYTTRDFPTIVDYTPVDERKFSPSFLSQMLGISVKRYLTQTQGFKVETNDMNGRAKAVSSYGQSDSNAIAYTKYYYKVDDENAAVKHLSNTVSTVQGPNGVINPNAQIGKDIELMTDIREEHTQSNGLNAEFNLDGFLLIWPVTFPTLWPIPESEDLRYRSAATMKLVQRYGILDRVMHYEKGSLITSQDQLYDAETGDVLLTKTQNEFNDPVYQFNYPAHWAYSGMGPAYKNIGATFSNVTFTNGKINGPARYNNIEHFFESGDEVLVYATPKIGATSTIDPCTGEGSCASPNFGITQWQTIWAINASKLQGNVNPNVAGIYFIDSVGNLFTTPSTELETATIIRSGKRNMAATAISAITSLASPVRSINNAQQLVFDDTTRVINSSAAAFKDFWAVEDAKYRLITTVVTQKNAMVTKTFTPDSTASFTISHERLTPNGTQDYFAFTNTDFFESSSHNSGSNKDDHKQKSWMKFDLSSIPAGATIVNATLTLYPHYEDQYLGGMSQKNHSASQPHYVENIGTGGSNSAAIYKENYSVINNINLANVYNNNASVTNALFENSQAPVNGSIVYLDNTVKENSYFLMNNVTGLAKDIYTSSGQQAYIAIQPWNADGLERLCFWSKDHYVSDPSQCQTTPPYAGNASINNNNLDNSYTSIDLNEQMKALNETAYGPNIDNSISSLVSGTNCPTAPKLTITYASCETGDEMAGPQCDTFYCIKRVSTDTCLSRIKDSSVNPYRWGILGNWRMDKSYSYYNTRKETDPLSQTDIRNNGVINGFTPYWAFNAQRLQATTDTFRWVWNSKLSLVNRKGYEIENTDPLGRYNSAQYGYLQTLPIAVTQNALYNEQAFDGFEDYGYSNNACLTDCPLPKHLPFAGIENMLTTTTSHSGKYSVLLNAGNNQTVNADMQLSDVTSLGTPASLNFKIDTTTAKQFYFSGANSGGLSVTYTGSYDYNNDNDGTNNFNYVMGTSPVNSYLNSYPDYDSRNPYNTSGSLGNNIVNGPTSNYKVVWTGALVATKTASYLFNVVTDNSFKLWINNKLIINAFPGDPASYYLTGNTLNSDPVNLYKGKVYSIRIEHTNGDAPGYAHLTWLEIGGGTTIFSKISPGILFKDSLTAVNSISTETNQCFDWKGLRSTNNIIYNELSPIPASKYVVSAWVKEDQTCHCQNYQDAQVAAVFYDAQNNVVGTSTVIKPAGNIIEGWQRLEGYVTIPATAKSMRLSLQSSSQSGYSGNVYFDDVRFHPYNANMKSYVYDPVNLRLMADLDENNYASFYEYDDDGTLIRVKKETEQGIKTIKETRSALLKQ